MAAAGAESRRVLVGVDRSPGARVALAHAARRAGASGCLIVAHVLPPLPPGILGMQTLTEFEADRRAAGRKLVEALAEDAGVATETRLVDGPPAAALAELARATDADEIVVGYDGSPPATAAMTYAARRAARGGRVVAVHAIEPAPEWLEGPHSHPAREAYRAHGRELLGALELLRAADDEHADRGVEVETALLDGPPARAIVAAADERDADEIVVGSRGFGRIRGVLGSVSHAVLHEADRPVVVIPADAAPGPDEPA